MQFLSTCLREALYLIACVFFSLDKMWRVGQEKGISRTTTVPR
jgi:hypothetical protein